MKKLLVIVVLLLLACNTLASGLMVGVSFNKTNENFMIDYVVPVKSDVKPSKGEGSYFIGFKENDYSQAFQPDTTVIVEPAEELFDENGNQIYFPDAGDVQRELDFVSFSLLLPYFEDVYTMQIKNKQGKILTEADIGFIQEMPLEGTENEIQNKQIQETTEQEEQKTTTQKSQQKQEIQPLLIAGLVITLIAVLYWLKKRKKKEK